MSKSRATIRFLVSFDGIVDLLTIIPAFFLSGFVIFRMLRVARVFHLFRLNAKYDSFNVITTVFIWKKKSDHLLCFYCADSHARQQSVHVQRRTRCTAWGIPQRFQRYLVEHVNASHRRLRRYLPDHNTCYLCFRKKTRFWNWMILLLYVGKMVKYTRQQWLLLCHKKA